MKKIKVMHIVPSLEKGGMEGGVVNLVNNIDSNMFELSICCLGSSGLLEAKIDKDRKKVFAMNQPCGRRWRLPVRLRRFFRQEEVDIVHTHNYATLLYGGLACLFSRKPYLVHGEHGDLPLQVNNFRHMLVRKMLATRISRFHTVSVHLKDLLINAVDVLPGKVEHIPNGLDMEKFGPKDESSFRQQLGFSEEDFIILGIGSFYPWKNFDLMIRAADVLRNDALDFKMILVGDGPLMPNLKASVDEKRLGDYVQFLGHRKDIPQIINVANVLVQPSLTEGMSNTIMEAMACAKPVIASDVGGNGEQVLNEVTGYLFKSNDADALVDRIQMLYNNRKKCTEFGQAAYKLSREKHSMASMVQRYKEFYLVVAGSRI